MFSLDEIDRYERQVLLPEWGAAGQERVLAAAVIISGTGAAAEAAMLYLAAAGVGRLDGEAFLDEARARNPHVTASAAPASGVTGVRITIAGGASIDGDEERAAVGAAAAVEALKAILGLPHATRVALPKVSG